MGCSLEEQEGDKGGWGEGEGGTSGLTPRITYPPRSAGSTFYSTAADQGTEARFLWVVGQTVQTTARLSTQRNSIDPVSADRRPWVLFAGKRTTYL